MKKIGLAISVLCLAGCSTHNDDSIAAKPEPLTPVAIQPASTPAAQLQPAPPAPQSPLIAPDQSVSAPRQRWMRQPGESFDQMMERERNSPESAAFRAEQERKDEASRQAGLARAEERMQQNREATLRNQEVRQLRHEQTQLDEQNKELSRKNPDFVVGGSDAVQRANDERDAGIREKQRQIDEIQSRR